jgi:hypothetical protein
VPTMRSVAQSASVLCIGKLIAKCVVVDHASHKRNI